MTKLSGIATLVAVVIGLVCACVIWVVQPINDYLLQNSAIADNYLPTAGVAMITFLALVVNPFLRWIIPSLALNVRQLAIIFAIIVVGCSALSITSSLPHTLAHSNKAICADKALADIHREMDLPKALYLDTIEYGAETPVSSKMADQLEDDETIPWKAWLKPSLAWGSMVAACMLLMIGLSLIVFPQWRDNERLPFPLLSVQQALIETPDDGGHFPVLFRSKLFWGGALTVFFIYALKGLSLHTHKAFPDPGLSWGLWDVFTGLLSRLPWYVKSGRIIFIIIGLTYFVPSRISFSLWFTVIAYAMYRVLGYQYFAPFYGDLAQLDHRNGAVIGMALVILWLGRRQWLTVAKAMFRPARNDVDRRNRTAGLMFCIGCLGLLAWQIWAGNTILFALLAVALVVVTSLVLARMVAETGIPVFASTLEAGTILSMMPIGWLSSKAIYLTHSVDLILTASTSKVSAAVTAMHGFGIDRENSPRSMARLAKGFFLLIIAGIIIAGAVHISLGYRNATSMGGKYAIGNPHHLNIEKIIHLPLKSFARESWNTTQYSRVGNTIFGFALAIALQVACLLSPLWPLHPAGLIVVDAEFFRGIWPCIFLGWAIKRSVIMYGGAKVYRQAKPLFLGLILGEVFAAMLWAAVPAILIGLGADAAEIGHLKM